MSNTTSSPMTSTRRAGITAPLVNQQVFGWWRAALKVDGEGCPTRSRCGSRSNNVHAHDVLHSDEVAARPFVVGEYEARGGPGHNHPAGAMSAAEHEGSILQRGDDLDECRGIAGPRGVSCAGCRARGFQRVHGAGIFRAPKIFIRPVRRTSCCETLFEDGFPLIGTNFPPPPI
jgi:hypothetical protein